MPRELLQLVFWQQFQDHANSKVGLLLLIALVQDVCKIEVKLADMFEADVLGIEEGCEPRIACGADVERNLMVELADRDFVQLFTGEADVLEVGWAIDLYQVLSAADGTQTLCDRLTCWMISVFRSTDKSIKASLGAIVRMLKVRLRVARQGGGGGRGYMCVRRTVQCQVRGIAKGFCLMPG